VTFGPWQPDIDAPERLARTRAMRALAGVFCHRHQQFAEALRAAETDQAELDCALGGRVGRRGRRVGGLMTPRRLSRSICPFLDRGVTHG